MVSRLISLSSSQELHKLALLYPQPYFLCLLNTHSQMYQWPTVPFLPISYIQGPFLLLSWISTPSILQGSVQVSTYLWSSSWLLEIAVNTVWAVKSDIPRPHSSLAEDFTCLNLLFLICTMGIMPLLISNDFHEDYTGWLINAKC